MAEPVISVKGVSKLYRAFDNNRSRILHGIFPSKTSGVNEIWALRNISFEVYKGQSLAIIGRNGGGKSTLLEILTGTLTPTVGEVSIKGRVCALLELGSGFNPEYTGRDNVMLNGLLLGLTKAEILSRFDEIEAFAEIGPAIDRPVKTYSSGMMVRLAFAVQVLSDPDILIIDEALSVGDFFFQQKCMRYIRSLREKGVTTLFVSHDMGSIRDLCDTAVVLDRGNVIFAGGTPEAIKHYMQTEGSEGSTGIERSPVPARVSADTRSDSRLPGYPPLWEAEGKRHDRTGLLAVWTVGEDEQPRTEYKIGETVTVIVQYRPPVGATIHIAVEVWNKHGQMLTSTGSSRLGLAAPVSSEPQESFVFCLSLKLMIEHGSYSLVVGAGEPTGINRGKNLDISPQLGPLSIRWDYERDPAPFFGMVGLEASGGFGSKGMDE